MNPSVTQSHRARAVAFYLPQFHPILENDAWWGSGFTEWTNVARAKPLFRGHKQPHIPADLGFYDLRVPETRQRQTDLARAAGIEAFCYWHYWFAGRRLLERPFQEVLASGQPDFPFCFGWANASWTGVWYGAPGRVLVEQTYPGMADHERHFEICLAPAFADPRYLRVDGKPLLLIFRPRDLPDSRRVLDFWRALADQAGLGGLHVVAHLDVVDEWNPVAAGFDAATVANLANLFYTRSVPLRQLVRRRMSRYPGLAKVAAMGRRPINIAEYSDFAQKMVVKADLPFEYHPCVIPNWDNTPRSGSRGSVLTNPMPEVYEEALRDACQRVQDLPRDHRIVFIKSWNEWAEGNYLEPDQEFGHQFLEATRRGISA